MTGMTRAEARAIEWDCQQLALRAANLGDARDFAALALLFTEDAVFARPTDPDHPIAGRDAIRAAFEARPEGRVTRHLCTNVVVDAVAPDRARGTVYVLHYAANAGDRAERFGLSADAVQLVGEFHDDYVLTGDGWRIARRLGRVTFSAGGHKGGATQ